MALEAGGVVVAGPDAVDIGEEDELLRTQRDGDGAGAVSALML